MELNKKRVKENRDNNITKKKKPSRRKNGTGERGKLKKKRGVAAGERYCLWCVISTLAPSSLAAGLLARLYHTENTGHLHKCRGQVSNASSNLVFSPQELRRLWKYSEGISVLRCSKRNSPKLSFEWSVSLVDIINNIPTEQWWRTDSEVVKSTGILSAKCRSTHHPGRMASVSAILIYIYHNILLFLDALTCKQHQCCSWERFKLAGWKSWLGNHFDRLKYLNKYLMEFCTGIHCPQRMHHTDICDPLSFPSSANSRSAHIQTNIAISTWWIGAKKLISVLFSTNSSSEHGGNIWLLSSTMFTS